MLEPRISLHHRVINTEGRIVIGLTVMMQGRMAELKQLTSVSSPSKGKKKEIEAKQIGTQTHFNTYNDAICFTVQNTGYIWLSLKHSSCRL